MQKLNLDQNNFSSPREKNRQEGLLSYSNANLTVGSTPSSELRVIFILNQGK
jgi:hypothetical protein